MLVFYLCGGFASILKYLIVRQACHVLIPARFWVVSTTIFYDYYLLNLCILYENKKSRNGTKMARNYMGWPKTMWKRNQSCHVLSSLQFSLSRQFPWSPAQPMLGASSTMCTALCGWGSARLNASHLGPMLVNNCGKNENVELWFLKVWTWRTLRNRRSNRCSRKRKNRKGKANRWRVRFHLYIAGRAVTWCHHCGK
jgi:hypothetical protein